MWRFIVVSVFVFVFGSDENQNSAISSIIASTPLADVSHFTAASNSSSSAMGNDTIITGDNTGPDCYPSVNDICPSGVECESLGAYCLQCDYDYKCEYGKNLSTLCRPKPLVNCTGRQEFNQTYDCLYCYQLKEWQYTCNESTSCSLSKPQKYYPALPVYIAVCEAHSSEFCLGRRCFYKKQECNWSRGYKWSTALILSITLGGFGVDRFYLGLWKEGIGKLFSFGGLGVWTIVDVILIAVGYIVPSDGSLYI